MKHIQLKYLGIGRRTVNLRVHGFMGPSRSPMGKGPLQVAGDYLRAGTLTTAFQLEVPPNGECQVVDCQHNRELLRKVTRVKKKFEEIKSFNEETGKYSTSRKEIEHPPGFKVIDDTPIDEDIVLETSLNDSTEVAGLKEKIAKMEAEKKDSDASKIDPNATASGETSLPLEDEEEPLSADELKKKRFGNKIEDPVSLV